MSNETADVQIRVYPKDNKELKRELKGLKAEHPQACIADVVRDLIRFKKLHSVHEFAEAQE